MNTKDEKTDNQAAGSVPPGRRFTGVLTAILKSLATVLIIVLLSVQVVELGLLLEKVSALGQPVAREEALRIPTPAASPTPLAEGESETAGMDVEFLTVEADDEGLTLTLEVHQSGPAALFFEQPVLEGEQTYEVDPDSLEEARFALLDAVTRGRAEIELRFTPAPDEGENLTLVFNPDHPVDDPVAPRIEVPVER